MRANMSLLRWWFCFSTLALTMGVFVARAQDESLAEIKYNEDYDRVQKIVKITQPLKRAEQLVALYKERPDMDSRIRDYADTFFAKDLESIMTQKNFVALKGLCEKALKARPKFGEAYLFLGMAYKHEGNINEAINALVKCAAIKSPVQKKGKQQLDIAYRATHNQSLIGEDKLIKAAEKGTEIAESLHISVP